MKLKTLPGTDPVAAARKWNARYKDLLHRSSVKRSSNPLELQIDAALDRFDLEACEEALRIYCTLARETPVADQPDEARTLNNVGVLFSHTQRPRQAEDAYRHALDLYRTLSRDNPLTYRQDEARTVGNLSELFSQTQRPRQAEEARGEANRLLDATDAP